MQRQDFEYSSLDGKGDIRMLCLHPGQPDDELQGTLEPLWINDQKKHYEAISYCWGDASDLSTMVCNGRKLTITKSSAAVLKRVRLKSNPRLVWIDRICIDQKNITERNQQVRQMKWVYESASTTLVWLGEEADSSHEAFGLVRELAEIAAISKYEPEKLQQRRHNVYNMSRLREWEALDALMNRQWWARAWVVQEASVSPNAIVICGSDTIEWSIFEPALSVPRSSSLEKRRFWKESGRTRSHYMKYTLISSFIDRDEKDIALKDLLVESRSKYATDPRDKVFAFYGLATDGHEDSPEADYSKSVERVYREVTKDIIIRDSNLSIIEYAGLSRLRLDLPSWCVDWTFGEGDDNNRPVPVRTLNWLIEKFNPSPSNIAGQYGLNPSASGSDPMEATFNESLSKLQCRGIKLDRISTVGVGATEDNYVEALKEASSFTTKCKNPYFTGEEADVAIKQAAHAGFWYDCDGKNLDEQHLDCANFNACEDRRFAVTDKGYVGVVPLNVKLGDVVYVIAGCEVPLVLRHVGGDFALVGQCYSEFLRSVGIRT
jgi:hypothetical protein